MNNKRKSLINDEKVAKYLEWLNQNALPLPPYRPEKLEAIKEEYKQAMKEKASKKECENGN